MLNGVDRLLQGAGAGVSAALAAAVERAERAEVELLRVAESEHHNECMSLAFGPCTCHVAIARAALER